MVMFVFINYKLVKYKRVLKYMRQNLNVLKVSVKYKRLQKYVIH